MPDDEYPFDQPASLLDVAPVSNGTYYTRDELYEFEQHVRFVAEHGPDMAKAVDVEYGRLKSRDIAKRLVLVESSPPASWARVDPTAALEAADHPIMPTVGRFAGQEQFGVFYAGCINSVVGPSETGKSWLTQYVAVQEMKAGHCVVYVDYEDDARSVYRRLKRMGMTHAELSGPLFKYHNPNGPLTERERKEFAASLDEGGTLLVCDGVTEGMGLEGLDTYKGEDVATWHARVTRDAARDGWCVVIIDHTPHSAERAIGSQHKKASITGVSYLVTAPDDARIDQGVTGKLFLAVEKDRHGSVRAEAARGKVPRHRGTLVVDDTATPMTVKLHNANKTVEKGEGDDYISGPPRDLLELIMAVVDSMPWCSGKYVRSGVPRRDQDIDAGVEWLINNGHLETKAGPRRATLHRVLVTLSSPPGEID